MCRVSSISEGGLENATFTKSKKVLGVFLLQLYSYWHHSQAQYFLYVYWNSINPQNMRGSCLITCDFSPISVEIYPDANYSMQRHWLNSLEHGVHKNEWFAFICGSFYLMTEEVQVIFLIHVTLYKLWMKDNANILCFIWLLQ